MTCSNVCTLASIQRHNFPTILSSEKIPTVRKKLRSLPQIYTESIRTAAYIFDFGAALMLSNGGKHSDCISCNKRTFDDDQMSPHKSKHNVVYCGNHAWLLLVHMIPRPRLKHLEPHNDHTNVFHANFHSTIHSNILLYMTNQRTLANLRLSARLS